MEKALERVHYREKIKEFTKSDEDRNILLLGVLKDNEELRDELQEIRRDYDNEKQGRCMYQDRVCQLQDALRNLSMDAEASQTIVVILDGDGALFKDEFYAKGRDGGAEAAYQLRTHIRDKLRRQFPDHNTLSWQLSVSLVLSLQGLARKLLACNIVTRPDQLIEFGHGWVTQPLFSLTDVGFGKDRADHKVCELLQANITAPQCKQVYFGPCSDAGYLSRLEELKPDRKLGAKITLIETRPAEPGFNALGFAKITIPSVFRNTNLPERPLGRNGSSAGPGLETNAKLVPSPRPAPAVINPAAATPPISETTSSDQETTSWITVGKSLGNGVGVKIGNKQKAPSKAFILLNRKDERVDMDLEKPDSGAEYRFAQRTKEKKMCNDFHLRGSCPIAEKKCPHLHGERLPVAEQLVLRQKARGLPCASGSRCRDFTCTFGHHCRYKDGCTYETCWFKNNHEMDFRPYKKLCEGCVQPVIL